MEKETKAVETIFDCLDSGTIEVPFEGHAWRARAALTAAFAVIARCAQRSADLAIGGETVSEVVASAIALGNALNADPSWESTNDYWWNFWEMDRGDRYQVAWKSCGTRGRYVGVEFNAHGATFAWHTSTGKPSTYLLKEGVYADALKIRGDAGTLRKGGDPQRFDLIVDLRIAEFQ